MNKTMKYPFQLLLVSLLASSCLSGDSGKAGPAGSTSSVVSNLQNDPDIDLASEVLESVNTVPVVTNKGSADVGFDIVLGPTYEEAGNSKALLFSYDRNAILQWAPKPFHIHEFNLNTLEKTASQVLPDSAGYLGLVKRYTVDHANHRIRLITTTPFNVVDWDYLNKVGTFIKAVSTNSAVSLHHYDLASDNLCVVDKLGAAYRLHSIKNGNYSMHSLGFLGVAPTAVICEDHFAYFIIKATTFKLYALDLDSNIAQMIHDQTVPVSAMTFYDILGEQYARLTTLNTVTNKNVAKNYKLNGTALTYVAALPVVPAAKTFDIKIDSGRATLTDPRVPIRFKQLKPVAAAAYTEVKLPFNYRPEVISTLFSRNSQLYLAGKAISKFAGGNFTKLGNPYNLVMKHFVQADDKFYMTNGATQLYVYDPTKSWTFEPNYLTMASTHANANPKLIRDFKLDGIVAIKKILPYEDKVVIGGTVTSKSKSRFAIYDPETKQISSEPAVSFDINDFLISEDKIYASTYSGVAAQKVFFALFDAASVSYETKYATVFPANQLIKLFDSPNGYYLSSNKQFIRLNEAGVQDQNNLVVTIMPKFIKTPNHKFLSIFNNKLVIVKSNGDFSTISDLAPLNIVINDFELVDNKLYIATKYGIIYEIKIPLATLILND